MKTTQKEEKEDFTDVTDEAVITRVQGGEDTLFDVIVDRYQEKLTYYIIRLVGSQDEARDVVQEALIKAHDKIETFDTSRRFSPWVYRIAHNEAINYLKKRGRKQTVSIDDDLSTADQMLLADVESASLEKWFHEELRQEMAAAIAQLPDKYADVIHMRFIEELSYQEISDRLDKSVNTVGTLVRRAKKKLLEIVIASEDPRP